MDQRMTTIMDGEIKEVYYHGTDDKCVILKGKRDFDGKEVIVYLAEIEEVDHEAIGTPKKRLYQLIKDKCNKNLPINIELSKVATKWISIKGKKEVVDYKIFRLI